MSGKKKKSPKKRASSTGKEYERVVAAIHRQFADGAEIIENISINGRQIDVAIRKKVVGYDMLIIVECKCYKRRIEVGKVDEVIGKREAVKAAMAVLVSDSGFTKGAIERATKDGLVQLISVIDTNNPKLRTRVTVPIQITLHEIAGTEHFELSCETGGLQLPKSDTLKQAIHDAMMRFVDWFNEKPDLPAGEHVHPQDFECLGHLFHLKSKVTKKINTYIKEDLFLDGIGIFDHATHAPTPESNLSIRIDLADVPTWVKVSNDYIFRKCKIQHRNLVVS